MSVQKQDDQHEHMMMICIEIHLALMTYNGWCAIKPNQSNPTDRSSLQFYSAIIIIINNNNNNFSYNFLWTWRSRTSKRSRGFFSILIDFCQNVNVVLILISIFETSELLAKIFVSIQSWIIVYIFKFRNVFYFL